MSNMSYCRFENTSSDLRDCLEAFRNGETDDFSEHETRGCNHLIKLCKMIVDEFGDFVAKTPT